MEIAVAALLEKETDAGADQVLAQSAVLACIPLSARILEEFILDKRADFGREKVIGTSNYIPRQVRVTCPAASAEGFAVGSCEIETSEFRVVNADSTADIRLEPLIARRESQNEVRQPHATVKPVARAGGADEITIGFPQGEIGVSVKAVVKGI